MSDDTPRNRGGRPSKLSHVLEVRDDGRAITVADRILDWLRIGMPRDTSCFRAGVSIGTFHHWLKEAARLEEVLHLHPERQHDLTDHEQELIWFSREVDLAVAEGESRYFTLLAQLARGGLPIGKTVTKYDRAGNVIETVQTTEQSLPSERALMWILEKRYPRNYPRGAQQVEISVGPRVDPLNEQERAAALFDAIDDTLREAARQLAAGDEHSNGHREN